MFSTTLILIGVLVVVALVGALWFLNARRFYRDLKPTATPATPAVDAFDTRRETLAAELVRTVRAQASYDREAVDALAAASIDDAAPSASERGDAEAGLEAAMNRVIRTANRYPDLAADADFQRIKAEYETLFGQTAETRGAFADGPPAGTERALDAAEARVEMGALSGSPVAMAGLDAAEGVAAASIMFDPIPGAADPVEGAKFWHDPPEGEGGTASDVTDPPKSKS